MLVLLVASGFIDPLVLQLILNTVTRGNSEGGFATFFWINAASTVAALIAAVCLIPVEGDWVPTIVTSSVLLLVMGIAVQKACSVGLVAALFSSALLFTYRGTAIYLMHSMLRAFGVELEFIGFPEGFLADFDLPVALRWFFDNGLWFDVYSGAETP